MDVPPVLPAQQALLHRLYLAAGAHSPGGKPFYRAFVLQVYSQGWSQSVEGGGDDFRTRIRIGVSRCTVHPSELPSDHAVHDT